MHSLSMQETLQQLEAKLASSYWKPKWISWWGGGGGRKIPRMKKIQNWEGTETMPISTHFCGYPLTSHRTYHAVDNMLCKEKNRFPAWKPNMYKICSFSSKIFTFLRITWCPPGNRIPKGSRKGRHLLLWKMLPLTAHSVVLQIQ